MHILYSLAEMAHYWQSVSTLVIFHSYARITYFVLHASFSECLQVMILYNKPTDVGQAMILDNIAHQIINYHTYEL